MLRKPDHQNAPGFMGYDWWRLGPDTTINLINKMLQGFI
jgi:hypothetical protein